MTRSSAEVLDIVGELSDTFQTIWQRNDGIEAFVSGKWDIAGTLPASLPTKEPMPSFDIKYDIARMKGKLNKPIELHIEPHSSLKRAETKADNLEDIQANWLVRLGLSSGGWLWDAIYYGETVKVYVPIWTEWTEYSVPTRRDKEEASDYNARVDAYQREWFGWSLTVDPVRTSAFLEHRRKLTMATREYELPFIDVARRYGDYKRGEERSTQDEHDLMLTVCREQFPWLRAGETQSTASGEASGLEKAKIKLVDDGVTISHSIEGIDKDGKGRYEQREVDSYDNPLGRPTLFVVSGNYNAGEPLDQRFEPLMLGMIQDYRNRDWHMSLLASHIASAAPDALNISKNEVAMRFWADATPEEREKMAVQRVAGSMQLLVGDPVSLSATADQIVLIQEQLTRINESIQRQRPSSAETESTMQRATLGSILRADEEEQLGLQSAVDSNTTFIDELLGALTHFASTAINPHYKKGSKSKSDADNPLYGTMTGSERVRGRQVDRGREVSLLPSDIDFPHTREVKAISVSLSAQSARRAEADARWFRPDNRPTITWDELQEEHGHTDVTGHNQKLWADTIFQMGVPDTFEKVAKQRVRFIEVFLGAEPGSIGEPLQVEAPEAQEGGPSGAPMRTGSPHVDGVSGEAMSAV